MRAVFEALKNHAETRGHEVALRDANLPSSEALSWQVLYEVVQSRAQALSDLGAIVGLGRQNSIANFVDNLALSLIGRTVVPLPFFFSKDQVDFVCHAAGIQDVVGTSDAWDLPAPKKEFEFQSSRKVTFTSGSSGQPKGVVLSDQEVGATIEALASIISPNREDSYLSILPQSQLLEEICGIYLPVLNGVPTVIDARLTHSLFNQDYKILSEGIARSEATMSLIAPQILAQWVRGLDELGAELPAHKMRFVAMGGAPVSTTLLAQAEAHGLPIYQGYGLSECGSVVSLNPIGENRLGSVGKPLPHCEIRVDGGEIVVNSSSNMEGYWGQEAHSGAWSTGDLGHFDEEGYLYIDGRKDNLIVLPNGRNLSPEWVEAQFDHIAATQGAALCLVDDQLVLLLCCVRPPEDEEVAEALSVLPDFAQPDHVFTVAPDAGILRSSGAVNRQQALTLAKEKLQEEKGASRVA